MPQQTLDKFVTRTTFLYISKHPVSDQCVFEFRRADPLDLETLCFIDLNQSSDSRCTLVIVKPWLAVDAENIWKNERKGSTPEGCQSQTLAWNSSLVEEFATCPDSTFAAVSTGSLIGQKAGSSWFLGSTVLRAIKEALNFLCRHGTTQNPRYVWFGVSDLDPSNPVHRTPWRLAQAIFHHAQVTLVLPGDTMTLSPQSVLCYSEYLYRPNTPLELCSPDSSRIWGLCKSSTQDSIIIPCSELLPLLDWSPPSNGRGCPQKGTQYESGSAEQVSNGAPSPNIVGCKSVSVSAEAGS